MIKLSDFMRFAFSWQSGSNIRRCLDLKEVNVLIEIKIWLSPSSSEQVIRMSLVQLLLGPSLVESSS